MYLHAQFLFALLQLRFHPMALCSWPVLVQRVYRACRLSPWPTRTQASQLSCNMLRLLMDNRFCCLVTKWCSKVGTQGQNDLFIWQSAGIVALVDVGHTLAVILCYRCRGRNASLSDPLFFLLAASDRRHDITRYRLSGQKRWPANEERDTPGKEQVGVFERKRIGSFCEMELVGDV